jgi:hypothetical protein
LHKAEAVHAYAGAAHENAETKKINTELAQGDGSGAGGLSTDAVNQAAMEKLMTGKEISGMGNASLAVKEKVRNAEAELIKKMGLTAAEAAMLPTNNKVKQKALGNMENWGAAVSKSVDQLDKTFDMAINLSKKLPLSDIQRINKMVIAGETEFGSGDAAAYGLAIQTVKSEYARMMSGPTSNAMTPVEAGRKADELISSQATPDQLPALKSVVMQEGKITKDSVKNQVDTLTESIDDPTGGRDKPQSSALSAADQDLISKYLKK